MGELPHVQPAAGDENEPHEDRDLLDDLPPTLLALHHRLRTLGAQWRAMLAASGHIAAEAQASSGEPPENTSPITDATLRAHGELLNEETPEAQARQRRKQRRRPTGHEKKGRRAARVNPVIPLSISVALSAAMLLTASSVLSASAIHSAPCRGSRRAA